MIDHVEVEVLDLERSGRFYDAVFHALGARRMPAGEGAVSWGVNDPVLRIAAGEPSGRGARVALRAAGKAAVDAAYEAGLAAGGAGDAAPAPRPREGLRAYAAALLDPDGLPVELVCR